MAMLSKENTYVEVMLWANRATEPSKQPGGCAVYRPHIPHTHTHTHTYIYIHTYTYVYIYICIYIYIYIYKHLSFTMIINPLTNWDLPT